MYVFDSGVDSLARLRIRNMYFSLAEIRLYKLGRICSGFTYF